MMMRRMVFEVYAPSSLAILITKRLAEDLDVVNSTLSELDLLGEAFICARCDPIFRKKLNWQHLVCWGYSRVDCNADYTHFIGSTLPGGQEELRESESSVQGVCIPIPMTLSLSIELAFVRKLTLETIFANDHRLDDVSTGVSVINISSIDNALDLENFINECKCETCSEARCWMPVGERCEICTKIGAVTTKLCENGMRVHIQKK